MMNILADLQAIPGLVVGVFLVGLSLFWIRGIRRTWKHQQLDPEINPRERDYYSRQFRRRLQASVLVGVIGLLIPVGDSLIQWDSRSPKFAYYWLLVLLLVLWVMLLALGDIIAIRGHNLPSLHSLRDRQQALQAEVARIREETERLKQQSGSNPG